MRIALAALALLLLAGPALAVDTPEEMFKGSVASLLEAVADKIDDLSDEDLDKVEKKVLKALEKAQKTGLSITVGIDKKALKKLGKMMKSVEKALKASDASFQSIDAALSSLKTALDSVVDETMDDAESEMDKLADGKNIGKVEKKLDASSTKLIGITSLWSTQFSKAWATYVKAILGYQKAISTAAKFYDKELAKGGTPIGFKFDSDGKLVNTSGKEEFLTDLIYDLKVSIAGQTTPIKMKLSDVATQGTLPISLGSGGSAFDPKTYSNVWSGLGNLGLKITGKIVYETTAGNMVFNFK